MRVSKDEPEAAATADLSAETGDPEGVRWAIPAAPTAATVAVPNATGIPRLGELLIESQLIASTQLDEALLQQSASGKRLGELLVELGAIDDFDLARVLATRLNLPLADLRQSTPEDDAIALVPEAMARANVAIPVRRTDEGLQIAMAFPQDAAAVDQMRGSAGLAVVPMIAPPSDIRRAIDKSYRALAGVSRHVDAFLAAEAITARTVTESDAGIDAPVVQVVNLIITQGVRDRASDIHIEPQDARVRVRYRIDGALHDVLALPANMGASVISRIKVLAGMDIVERRKPQDGQIAMEVDGRPLDIRVSTTATIWGEKSVMRLLDKNRSLFRLGDLGMPDETHDRFSRLIRAPFGMVICAGPTGSGKTTTLYAALTEINNSESNIMTVEDVETRMSSGHPSTSMAICPSCGLRRSTMSIPASTLMRLMTDAPMLAGSTSTPCKAPSIRYRTRTRAS